MVSNNNQSDVQFVSISSLEGEALGAPFKMTKEGKAFFGREAKSTDGLPPAEYHRLCKIMKDIGLPIKHAMCLNGFRDTLFFTKDHGFVLRLSIYDEKKWDNDFFRRMHGTMIAPIGWGRLLDKVQFYLYPGEHLLCHDFVLSNTWKEQPTISDERFSRVNFAHISWRDSFIMWDAAERNVGVIYEGGEAFPILVDTDDFKVDKGKINAIKRFFNTYAMTGVSPAHAYDQAVLENTSNRDYARLALRHQELREVFFDAWPGAHDGVLDYDRQKMKGFLDLCYQRKKENRLYPSWKKPVLI